MKTPSFSFQSRRVLPSLIQYSAALGLVVAGSTAQAVDYFKADNTTNLNQSASWTGSPTAPTGSAPSDTYDWIWDNRVTAANAPLMGNDLRVRIVKILNPGGSVTIDGSTNTRTLSVASGGGIDMSAATQDLTIQNLDNRTSLVGLRLLSSGGNMSIAVASGRTLTLQSKITAASNAAGTNSTVNFTGPGTMICNAEMLANRLNIESGEVQLNLAGGSARPGTGTTPFTNVNGGRLVVNNTSGSATGNGPVNVKSTATLTGQGIMSGLVTIESGATVSPGNGLGTIKAGSLNLAAGSTIRWEGDPTLALTADLIDVTGTDTLAINGGTLQLFDVGTNTPFSGSGTFNILKYNGSIPSIGNLSVAESSKLPDRSYIFGVAGGYVTLTIGVDNRPKAFWNVDANGNWATPGSWTGGAVPDAATFVANLGGAQGTPITAPRTVTIASAQTVGTLNFDSVQPFTLAGGGFINFDEGDSAGTLHVENGSHVISAAIVLPTEGILASVKNAPSTLTLQGVIDGVGGISKSGPGTLVLAADNTYLGATSNGAGILRLGSGGVGGSVNGSISNNGTLQINRSDSFRLSYPISGSGGVEFIGSGTTSLAAPNTFSGPTTIAAGTVVIEESLALQNSTLTYSSTSGTLTYEGGVNSVVLGGLTGDKSFPLDYINTLPEVPEPVAMSLTVGKNNESTSYSGSTTGGTTFTKTGTGTFTLSGSHAFTGNTTITGGVLKLDTGSVFTTNAVSPTLAGAKLLVNGGTFTASLASQILNASAGVEVASGTANFNGGITSEGNPSNNAFFVNVTGGTLNSASISIPRGNVPLYSAEPATGSATAGLYINGGAVNIAGNLGIGNNSSNSSVNTRIDSGSLTVNGITTLTIFSPDRWSILDIAGGTFTSNDTTATGGVRIGGTTAGQVIMQVRNISALNPTVAKAERFQFGQAAVTGSAILNQTAGNLYVGAGGMVVGSTNPAFNAQLRLGGGVLGATADSISTVPVSLTGPAVVTGADALDVPHTVSFSGKVDGTGSLTKNGSGSVSFTSPANSFTGAVTVNSGTLGLGGQSGAVTVAPTASLTPVGTLNAQAASTINGTLAIRYDGDNLLEPGGIRSQGTLTLGAGFVLNIEGTGTLTDAVYFLASGAAGIIGTVGTPTGTVPAGYTLNTSFNSGTAIALVSNTASPYDLWASGFGLSGESAGSNADPDGDGVKNLVEYGQGSNPSQFSAGPVLGNSGGFLTLSFNHIANGGVTFAIEANDGLDDAWDVVQTYPTFGAAGTTVYTDNVALATAPRRFLRLVVIKN